MKLITPIAPNLDPRVILMATTRVFRIKQVGTTFFVENMQRKLDVVEGEVVHEDEWKVVAIAKPQYAQEKRTAYEEAVSWMLDANKKVLDIMRMEMKKQHAPPR